MQKCQHFYNKFYIFVSNFNQKVRFFAVFFRYLSRKAQKNAKY